MADDTERRWAVPAGAVIVFCYALYFIGPSLRAGFNADDPMNLYGYWSKGGWALLRGILLFFSTYYRPMGGVFYSLLYHFFGLDPRPYHLVIVCLLLLNTWLAYRFGWLLSGSRLIGGFCALIVAYHAGMAHLAYLPSFVYDVLCFTFYFLTLNYYLAIRGRGEALGVKRTIVFLLLYIGALESKEMAVTLPVMIVLYEAIWNGPRRWKLAIPGLIAGLLTAVYIAGKMLGPDPITVTVAYQPIFRWGHFMAENTKYLNQIFYQPGEGGLFTPTRTLGLWALLLYAAYRRKEKHLFWAACFVVIAPLPIAFLPIRGGPNLYIPLAGWALIAATLYLALVRAIAREPALGRMPRARVALETVLVLAGVWMVWHETARRNRGVPEQMMVPGREQRQLMGQLRALQPRVPPGSSVIFLDDIFETWDTLFIAQLVWRDRSVEVWLQHQSKLPPAEIEKMDYVFRFVDHKPVRVKPP